MYKQRNKPSGDKPVFGIRAVEEAIEAGKEIDKIFIKKGLQGELFKGFFKS